MEFINNDILQYIMSFLFSREITNLLNTCKTFQKLQNFEFKTDDGEMDLTRKTIHFLNHSQHMFYNIIWKNFDRLDTFNLNRCWKCGSIFFSKKELLFHLKRMKHTMVYKDSKELDIQIEKSEYFFNFQYKVPSLYNSKCSNGKCDCPSKKYIYDDIRKKGVVTFFSDYGHLTIRSFETFQKYHLSRQNEFCFILKDTHYLKMPCILNSGKHWWIRPPSLNTEYLIPVRDIN